MKLCLLVLKILNINEILNEILPSVKGHNSITNVPKIMCNNPNIESVDINTYTKFCEILSICLKDIVREETKLLGTDGRTYRTDVLRFDF